MILAKSFNARDEEMWLSYDDRRCIWFWSGDIRDAERFDNTKHVDNIIKQLSIDPTTVFTGFVARVSRH